MAANIRRGDRVRAKATYFDEQDGDNTWSRQHFGDNYDISYCWGTVRKVENKFARVYWDIDKKVSTVPVGYLIADHENENLNEANTNQECSPSESDSSTSSEDEEETNNYPTTSTSNVINSSENIVVVKGVTWTFMEAIRLDQRQQGNYKATLQEPLRGTKSVKDAFFMVFPREKVHYIIQCTNSMFPAKQKVLIEKELLLFIGIMYAMTLQELPDRRCYWNTTSEGIYPPANFGQRFGMSRQRFETILMALRFTQPSDLDDSDRWRNVRTLVTMVNEKLEHTIRPGSKITVDESMFAWYGRGAYFKDGMPAVMKIKRKPKGVGCEVKTACDSGTNIMIRMEINEGKESMSAKKWQRELGAGTATTLRLTEPWHGSGRVVVGDSWFASVKTAVELSKVGLYFIGLVKTAHSFYPSSEMATRRPSHKGASVVKHDQVSHRWFTTNLVLALTGEDTDAQLENVPPPNENIASSGEHILEALHGIEYCRKDRLEYSYKFYMKNKSCQQDALSLERPSRSSFRKDMGLDVVSNIKKLNIGFAVA
ncbi:piggyBac transposable element-derived protein 3-like [Maniola hyperantus]|uniref:piggyBac transposable element-derived protein 3-like n=1 Tax=Aphantopus hyperantus TaxID=2795564 RepID=UPI00374A6BED